MTGTNIKRFFGTIVVLLLVMFPLRAWAGFQPAIRDLIPAGSSGAGEDIMAGEGTGRVVFVIVDYLQVKEFTGILPPNLQSIKERGACALMNANTGGSSIPENTYITIGAGAHAVGYDAATLGSALSEKLPGGTAAEQYLQRTGRSLTGSALVYLDINRIRYINKKLFYNVEPGALGDAVHKAGFQTAALGNSDYISGNQRQVISVVMDRLGVVDMGSVGMGVLKPEREFIGGYSTNYDAILGRYAALPPEVRLVAIDLGDLSRLQGARDQMSRLNWVNWRNTTISRIDDFVGSLAAGLKKDQLLILVTPTPGDNGKKKDYLTPVLIYGPGQAAGLLTSPTTRRAGIIMNTDLAPTALSFLGIPAEPAFTGRPVSVIPGSGCAGLLSGMYDKLVLTYEARGYMLKGYVLYQMVLLAASLIFIFLKGRGKEYLKPFLLSVMAVPLVFLIMPLLPQPAIGVVAFECIALVIMLTVLLTLLQKISGTEPFVFICLATAAVLAFDIIAGSPLQKTSLLGYDPIVGARFYGIGNEYMGILVGSLLVGTTAAFSMIKAESRKYLVALTGVAYIVMLYLIAAPQYGTNVGGTIAAAVAFLVVFLQLMGVRFNWRWVIVVAGAVMLVVLSLVAYDYTRDPSQQSHIGRTAQAISKGGIGDIVNIVNRKWEMNIRLIKYTIWSRIFLASLGMLALLFYRPSGVMAGIRVSHPYLFKGFTGVVAGSIFALAFNDSGVVAAATTMIFGAPPLIYLVLGELQKRGLQKGP